MSSSICHSYPKFHCRLPTPPQSYRSTVQAGVIIHIAQLVNYKFCNSSMEFNSVEL